MTEDKNEDGRRRRAYAVPIVLLAVVLLAAAGVAYSLTATVTNTGNVINVGGDLEVDVLDGKPTISTGEDGSKTVTGELTQGQVFTDKIPTGTGYALDFSHTSHGSIHVVEDTDDIYINIYDDQTTADAVTPTTAAKDSNGKTTAIFSETFHRTVYSGTDIVNGVPQDPKTESSTEPFTATKTVYLRITDSADNGAVFTMTPSFKGTPDELSVTFAIDGATAADNGAYTLTSNTTYKVTITASTPADATFDITFTATLAAQNH